MTSGVSEAECVSESLTHGPPMKLQANVLLLNCSRSGQTHGIPAETNVKLLRRATSKTRENEAPMESCTLKINSQ